MASRNNGAWFSDRAASLIVDNPWKVLLLGLVLTAAGLAGMGKLKADFSHHGFFRDDDPQLLEEERFERRFGNDDAVVVVFHSPSGIFDMESAQLLQELTDRMWQIPDIIRVQSLSNFQWVHAAGDEIEVESLIPDDVPLTPEILAERKAVALAHETMPGFLVSRDAKTALIFAYVRPAIEPAPDMPVIVGAVREMVKEFQKGDHEIYITGRPAVNAAFKESAAGDMERLIPVVLLLTIVFLYVSFRRVSGVVMPVLVITLAILMTLGISGWLGLKMTSLTASVPQILIAVGIAYAVHVLNSFFAAQRQGKARKEAARYALSINFKPTLLTSISTVAGFLSFSTSSIVAVSDLGILTGIGTLLSWVLSYMIVGPLLVLVPIRVKQKAGEVEKVRKIGPRMARYIDLLERRRVVFLGVYAVVCLAALGISLTLVVNANPFEYFAEGYPLRVANEFIEAHVGGASGVEIIVDSGAPEGVKDPAFLGRVDAYQKWLEKVPGVTRTVSILDILKQTNRSLHGGLQSAYALPATRDEVAQQIFLYTMSLPQGMDINDRVTVQNDALRVTVLWTIHDSSSATAAADLFRSKAAEMGLEATVTGKMLLYQSMNDKIVTSFVVSLLLAVVQISVLLMIAVGSLRLGLLALIPNMVPLVLGTAILRLMGEPLDMGTVLFASICLGIAVDDTIHFITNFDRWRKEGASAAEAVGRIFSHTLPAVMITTLVLVMSFGAFAFSTFVPNRNFGIMTAIILTIGLLVELTLLPPLLFSVRAWPQEEVGTVRLSWAERMRARWAPRKPSAG